jgi:hypothetical protein
VTTSPTPSTSAEVGATPSPTPPWVARQVALGPVSAMALDAVSVYVLYAPTPTVGVADSTQTRLARIDRHSGSVRTAGVFPGASDLLVSGGWLWIGGGVNGDGAGPATDWLYQVDPTTLKVKQKTRLPQPQDARAYTAAIFAGTTNLLWMGYGRHLFRLDPLAGNTIRTLSLPAAAVSLSMEPAGRLLYVGMDAVGVSEATVTELDALTGARLASVSTGGAGLGGPHTAASDGGVWVAYATGCRAPSNTFGQQGLVPSLFPGEDADDTPMAFGWPWAGRSCGWWTALGESTAPTR